jgi:hypothetical protein
MRQNARSHPTIGTHQGRVSQFDLQLSLTFCPMMIPCSFGIAIAAVTTASIPARRTQPGRQAAADACAGDMTAIALYRCRPACADFTKLSFASPTSTAAIALLLLPVRPQRNPNDSSESANSRLSAFSADASQLTQVLARLVLFTSTKTGSQSLTGTRSVTTCQPI